MYFILIFFNDGLRQTVGNLILWASFSLYHIVLMIANVCKMWKRHFQEQHLQFIHQTKSKMKNASIISWILNCKQQVLNFGENWDTVNKTVWYKTSMIFLSSNYKQNKREISLGWVICSINKTPLEANIIKVEHNLKWWKVATALYLLRCDNINNSRGNFGESRCL